MREEDYRKLVMDEFERQRKAGILPPELLAPKRKGLKDHCAKICRERYQKKDEPLLKSFYGERNSEAEYKIAAEKANAEAFRNLHNYLTKERGTEFINICILAWMINFEPRPYRYDLEHLIQQEDRSQESEKTFDSPETEPVEVVFDPVLPEKNTSSPISEEKQEIIIYDQSSDSPKSKFIWSYAMAAILVLIALGTYFEIRKPIGATGTDGCMIWTGEIYRKVPCSYKPEKGGVAAIPLDVKVLANFRKIDKVDTLTANSIGKVYCVKINGRYEYFTDSAANPVYPERPLRVLTHFIMNNDR